LDALADTEQERAKLNTLFHAMQVSHSTDPLSLFGGGMSPLPDHTLNRARAMQHRRKSTVESGIGPSFGWHIHPSVASDANPA